jgi:hypothetical protein
MSGLLHLVFITSLLGASIAQAQRAPEPAPLPRHQLAVPAEKPRPEELRRILGAEPNEAELLSHRHYKAKDGHEVHSPAKSTHDQVPAGVSAKCRDGSYSFSQHRRGTCSHHGGVSSWL